MRIKTGATALVAAVLAAALAGAQAPAPQPAAGCVAAPALMAAERELAMAFFRPGVTAEQRIAMVAPDYVQHNPRFRSYARINRLSDHDAFVALAKAGQLGRPPAVPPGAPPPPPGDPFALVTVQCDVVTIVHKGYRLDPATPPPGSWYDVYSFDAFRVRDGKLAEHWDGATLTPPG